MEVVDGRKEGVVKVGLARTFGKSLFVASRFLAFSSFSFFWFLLFVLIFPLSFLLFPSLFLFLCLFSKPPYYFDPFS